MTKKRGGAARCCNCRPALFTRRLPLLPPQGRMHELAPRQLSKLAAALAKASAGRPHLLQELADAATEK